MARELWEKSFEEVLEEETELNPLWEEAARVAVPKRITIEHDYRSYDIVPFPEGLKVSTRTGKGRGCYALFVKEPTGETSDCVYVGESSNLRVRLLTHAKQAYNVNLGRADAERKAVMAYAQKHKAQYGLYPALRSYKDMQRDAYAIVYHMRPGASKEERELLELQLILQHRPRFNRMLPGRIPESVTNPKPKKKKRNKKKNNKKKNNKNRRKKVKYSKPTGPVPPIRRRNDRMAFT